MPDNRVVVYKGPGQVAVESIDYPKLELPSDVVDGLGIARKAPHAAILKIVTTNICGSDQHMVRGRTTAPVGQSLGHEITGEIVEVGDDVLFAKVGDICSVPFNIACGRCRMCNEGKTGVCLNVNPARPGAAYGYVDMGGWIGGQAEYVMVPFADFNLLRFPDRDQALEKILDLTMLSDIFPTGYHGAVTAGVTTGSTVYVAGAGPVGLAAAHAAQLLGAAAVVVGDMIPERLAQARSFGCETVDLSAMRSRAWASAAAWSIPARSSSACRASVTPNAAAASSSATHSIGAALLCSAKQALSPLAVPRSVPAVPSTRASNGPGSNRVAAASAPGPDNHSVVVPAVHAGGPMTAPSQTVARSPRSVATPRTVSGDTALAST